MVSTLGKQRKSSSSSSHSHSHPQSHRATKSSAETVVFGQPDRSTLHAIDRMAEQMLMPRSWVVTQILREWAEGRAAELRALEESWNGSYREELARTGTDA
jgi:hypothetical protein